MVGAIRQLKNWLGVARPIAGFSLSSRSAACLVMAKRGRALTRDEATSSTPCQLTQWLGVYRFPTS
jgi:hypothetical protein